MASYRIYLAGGIVEVTLAGRLNYDTVSAMLEELEQMADRALPSFLSVLVDETAARAGLLHYSQIREWTGRWGQAAALKEGRIAVIAPNLVMFGLNRMAQGVAGDDSVGHLAVFRDRAEALAWLSASALPAT